jgi:hypothetical protein
LCIEKGEACKGVCPFINIGKYIFFKSWSIVIALTLSCVCNCIKGIYICRYLYSRCIRAYLCTFNSLIAILRQLSQFNFLSSILGIYFFLKNSKWKLYANKPKFQHQILPGPDLIKPVQIRVARCYISKPKIPIWVNFLVLHERCWSILWPFGKFYCHLGYFMAIWYILW